MGNLVRARGRMGSRQRYATVQLAQAAAPLRAQCCVAWDGPAPPRPSASPTSGQVCVLLQERAPASPQAHACHASRRQQGRPHSQCLWFPAGMTTSFWLAWTIPLLKVKACHLGNPSVPEKHDRAGHPVPAHATCSSWFSLSPTAHPAPFPTACSVKFKAHDRCEETALQRQPHQLHAVTVDPVRQTGRQADG